MEELPQPRSLRPRDRPAVHGPCVRLRDPRLPTVDGQRTGRPRRPRRPRPRRRRPPAERATRADARRHRPDPRDPHGPEPPASPTSPPRQMSERPSRTGSRRSRQHCSRSPGSSPGWRCAAGPAPARRSWPSRRPRTSPVDRGSASRSGLRCSATRSGCRSTSSDSSRGCRGDTVPHSRAPSRTSPTNGASSTDHDRNDADFWERDLAAQMAEVATGLPRGEAVRRDHRRRGAGLRRPLVASAHEGAQGRGGGRALRLLR